MTGRVTGEEGKGEMGQGLVSQMQALGFHSKGISGPLEGLFKESMIDLPQCKLHVSHTASQGLQAKREPPPSVSESHTSPFYLTEVVKLTWARC